MGSPWKALSEDSRREMLLLLKRDTIPTEIAERFNFTLPALSSHLRILKDADLITEKKQGKNRFYSLNRHITLELVEFFEDMYDYNLKSLKEYVEGKEKKKKKSDSHHYALDFFSPRMSDSILFHSYDSIRKSTAAKRCYRITKLNLERMNLNSHNMVQLCLVQVRSVMQSFLCYIP
jgi:ArsR family transcriptional regulator